jgi:RNA polymerase sigma-70 factor (ECF subfamily)
MEWIERTRKGDQNAFRLIFDQYKNLVFKTAYLILDDASEAEDALQEVFLKVYRSLGTYDSTKGAFSTWIYRITVNYCLNQRRKVLRFFKGRDVSGEINQGDQVSLDENISNQEIIRGALQTLSQKLRVVIILRFFLDLSYSEIAQVLEIPLGTVKSRLNLGLNKIRAELKHENAQESALREVSE